MIARLRHVSSAVVLVLVALPATFAAPVVVKPADASPTIAYAAEELARVLRGAPIVTAPASLSATKDAFLLKVGLASRPPESYEIRLGLAPDRRTYRCTLAGADDRGVLWAVRDFAHFCLPHLRDLASANAGRGTTLTSHPAIRERGLWTWGGPIYDFRRYIDNMSQWKLNTLVIWNNSAPTNAREVMDYARIRGVDIVWGFSWCWGNAVDPGSAADRDRWRQRVCDVYRSEYQPLGSDAIYFQTFTEGAVGDAMARYGKSEGQLFVDWVTPIITDLRRINPRLRIYAGVHYLPDMPRDDGWRALAALDPAVNIMWEDLGAFPFSYSPGSAAGFDEGLARVRSLVGLRGANENFGFVVKGLANGLFGSDKPAPIGVTAADAIEAMVPSRLGPWRGVEAGWRRNYARYLTTMRLCADAHAANSAVVALVENGLWEARQWLPVAMMAEGLWNPTRKSDRLVADLEAVPSLTVLYSGAQRTLKHLALGKPCTLAEAPSDRYPDDTGRKLTDGEVGPTDCQSPEWCGWEGKPVSVTVDLGAARAITSAGGHFLRSQPWGIFYPRVVRVSLSDDGVTFREAGKLEPPTPHVQAQDAVEELMVALPAGTKARYLRVEVESIGPCPDWHPAHGAASWLFLSELIVR